MPRFYKSTGLRSYKKHDPQLLAEAVSDIKNNKISYKKASAKYGISRSVLFRHCKGDVKKQGGQTALSAEEEDAIIRKINLWADRGYPLNGFHLRLLIKNYLDKLGRNIPRFKDNQPGKEFVISFLARNKNRVSKRFYEHSRCSRAAVSQQATEEYFANLEETLRDDPPSHIINYDETDLSDDVDTEDRKACRTCMKKVINTSDFVNLNSIDINSTLTIKQKLISCIPELDLNIIPKALICKECYNLVTTIFNFKSKCIQTELQIQKHQLQHISKIMNFVEVAQFEQRPHASTSIKTETEDIQIKEEEIDIPEDPIAIPTNFSYFYLHDHSYALPYKRVLPQEIGRGALLGYQNLNKTLQNCSSKNNVSVELPNDKVTSSIEQDVRIAPKNYRCCFCNFSTKYKGLIKNHERVHLTKQDYKQIRKKKKLQTNIESCKKVNTSIRNEIRRLRTNLKFSGKHIAEENYFKCLYCNFQGESKLSLESHTLTHTGQISFQCVFCDYRSTKIIKLKSHILTHAKKKLFPCTFCNFRSNYRSSLKTHIEQNCLDVQFE